MRTRVKALAIDRAAAIQANLLVAGLGLLLLVLVLR
jgi:hypothetical protein